MEGPPATGMKEGRTTSLRDNKTGESNVKSVRKEDESPVFKSPLNEDTEIDRERGRTEVTAAAGVRCE